VQKALSSSPVPKKKKKSAIHFVFPSILYSPDDKSKEVGELIVHHMSRLRRKALY
jgi:hypothetical protein